MAITMEIGGNKAPKKEITNSNTNDIKETIKKGMIDSNNRAEALDIVLKDIENFMPIGIDTNTINILESMKFLFSTTVPALLKGDYDTLINKSSSDVSDESLIVIYKDMRKQLVQNLMKK